MRPEKYVGLFVSGGRAPEYLRYNANLLRLVRHFFDKKKPVAVICHGVEIVAAAGVLQGRTMTTIAKCALDITQVGGKYIDKPCVLDGNLVSARGWQDYQGPFMRRFLRMLEKGPGVRGIRSNSQ